MTMLKTNENGRSMIEMLGVLAIIGVLSVGGIAGYSKAMNKFKTNKVADNVSMIVANIKTLYAQQKDYGTGDKALTTAKAIDLGVIPDELIKSGTGGDKVLKNAYNGDVFIKASNSTTGETGNRAFVIVFDGLSKEACITLATNDWGSGFSSGLIALHAQGEAFGNNDLGEVIGCTGTADASNYINGGIGLASGFGVSLNANGDDATTPTAPTTTPAAKGYTACPGHNMPMPVAKAAKACACDSGNTCSVTWKYY